MPKTQTDVIDILSAGVTSGQPFILQWQNIYYRTAIHTTGTCPSFHPIRYESGERGYSLSNSLTYPAWWISGRFDAIFDAHLLNRYPREPEITREFRKSVYRPYQMAPLLEAISSLSACIFGDSKYMLKIEDTEDDAYINGNNFDGKTFVGYFEHFFKAICEDPNSLFMVVPKVNRHETGDKVEPVLMHIPSAEILWITEDEIVFYEPFKDRNYGWWVTETGYFQFEKVGNEFKNVSGEADGYYSHQLLHKPLHFAGGVWNTLRYFDSYLKAAIPFCDDFVASHSDVQMINKEACFPFIQMVETDCPQCKGIAETNYCLSCNNYSNVCSCDTSDIRKIKCPECKGTGQLMSFNPGQRILVPAEDADKDMMKIINFDVNINKFLSDYSDGIKEGIKKALHQQSKAEKGKGVESASSKEIDREAEYLYRSMVSGGVWRLMEACLKDTLALRHMQSDGDKRVPVLPKYELVPPTDFALKTEGDLLNEYEDSTAALMPDWVRQKQVEQYVNKVFGGNDTIKRKVSLINQMDAYSVTAIVDKTTMLSANAITIEDFTFSNTLPSILDKLIRDKKDVWFNTSDYDTIKQAVDLEFKTYKLPKPEPIPKPTNVKTA